MRLVDLRTLAAMSEGTLFVSMKDLTVPNDGVAGVLMSKRGVPMSGQALSVSYLVVGQGEFNHSTKNGESLIQHLSASYMQSTSVRFTHGAVRTQQMLVSHVTPLFGVLEKEELLTLQNIVAEAIVANSPASIEDTQ